MTTYPLGVLFSRKQARRLVDILNHYRELLVDQIERENRCTVPNKLRLQTTRSLEEHANSLMPPLKRKR